MPEEIKFIPEVRKWVIREAVKRLVRATDLKKKAILCELMHPAILTLPVEAYENLPLVMKGN